MNKTRSSYQTQVSYYKKWIQPVIGHKSIKDVRPSDVEQIKSKLLEQGKAPRTVQYVLSITGLIFNYASDHNYFNGDNPVKKIKSPKYDNRRLAFFTPDQAATLLELLAKRSTSLYEMTLLSLRCGLRAGEIFGLTWQDINLERASITIRDPKNSHNRTIPMMSQDIAELFKRRTHFQEGLFVFPDRNGNKRKEVSDLFARIIKEIGFNKGVEDRRQKLTFHSLRHTCASWLVMNGVPLFTVKELLGHRSITMTDRYSHLAPDAFESAKKAMASIKI